MTAFSGLKKNWFLIGTVVAIATAKLFPNVGAKGGILYPEYTVKYGAVFVIFLISGLSLRSEELGKALRNVKLHVSIQLFSLVLVPILVWCLTRVFSFLGVFDGWLVRGLQALSCMPPPVSTAVILTRSVGGNEAAALFNSVLASLLGVLVTPASLSLFIGSQARVSFAKVAVQLCGTIILPLLIGQLLRSRLTSYLERKKLPLSEISSTILLVTIYTTFCDTFKHQHLNLGFLTVTSVIVLVFGLHALLLSLAFLISQRLELLPEDTVCMVFCSTHKSLTMGITMISVMFGSDPNISVISLPLLIYHPTQVLLGGLLVPSARHWLAIELKRTDFRSSV